MVATPERPSGTAWREDRLGQLRARDEFARIVASSVLQPVDDAEVTSVVCFVIAPRARRRGVARALLEAVIAYATEHGIALLEAYPVDRGERAPGAELWRGPRRLYEVADFTVAATRQANATARPQLIMRRPVVPVGGR
jgi:GNAT superfamily N-acetyltransferase